MRLHKQVLALSLGCQAARAASTPLDAAPGKPAVIPAWDIQSTAKATADPAALSKPGADTSSWNHVKSSRCTVMGCLVAAGVYNESDLFFSTKLSTVDQKQFQVPWLYRNEFSLSPSAGQYFILETNGITSRADLYFNGKQIADKAVQSGAYGGQAYDVSSLVAKENALVVKAYPTNYMQDFALGFVDWNPYPPDNGTGVWRDVVIRQTGQVAVSTMYVMTDFKLPSPSSATVTVKVVLQNLGSSAVTASLDGLISRDNGGGQGKNLAASVKLDANQTATVNLTTTVDSPAIWWPRQWGDQPLYGVKVSVSVNGSASDAAQKTFGFRQVTSKVAQGDVTFSVNGQPFQVLGGGYTSDMFLRWDSARFEAIARYTLDMGFNTIRLEGKMEQPELYETADRLGLMVLPGWECCDKWEAWPYNDNLPKPIPTFSAADYDTVNASMRHEAAQLQAHPSILGFLVGSDFWPDDKATAIYLDALRAAGWQMPVIASAATKEGGYPKALGPPGMKMDGPYDWVPPNYWFDVEPAASRAGAAFGFGSEQGAGVGTPELSSLKRFLSSADLDDLWKSPNKGLYHMSKSDSTFYTRKIYNDALWARWGAPTGLDDYLMKAQITDYEAARAEYEGFSAMWNAKRPATGVIYWMLNSAWPALHWSLFDYYLRPAGAYYGTKAGSRLEHVAYDPVKKAVWLINHSLDRKGARTVRADLIGPDGKAIGSNQTASVTTTPNTSKSVLQVAGVGSIKDAAFLRLTLADEAGATLSRNVYWLASAVDAIAWDKTDWYWTPVSKYASFQALNKLEPAKVVATSNKGSGNNNDNSTAIVLENQSSVPAFFVSLALVDAAGADVTPVYWSDNYVTLWPGEKLEVHVSGAGGAGVQLVGKNVARATVNLA